MLHSTHPSNEAEHFSLAALTSKMIDITTHAHTQKSGAHARTHDLITVVVRLERPLLRDVQVIGLVLAQRSEVHLQLLQVQAGDLLVQTLRQRVRPPCSPPATARSVPTTGW